MSGLAEAFLSLLIRLGIIAADRLEAKGAIPPPFEPLPPSHRRQVEDAAAHHLVPAPVPTPVDKIVSKP